MGVGRLLVAAAVDDGEVLAAPEPFKAQHAGVEAEIAVQLEQLIRLDANGGALPVVGIVAVWHDGVQSVIASGKLNHH